MISNIWDSLDVPSPVLAGIVAELGENVRLDPYGARGDGVADDAAAITAADAAAAVGTKLVVFPPGVYKVNSSVSPSAGVTWLSPVPRAATIKGGAGLTFALIDARAPLAGAAQLADIRLEGLILDANNLARSLMLAGVKNFVAVDCVMKGGNAGGNGNVEITGRERAGVTNPGAPATERMTFVRCEIGPSADHGVAFFGGEDTIDGVVSISDITFLTCYVHDHSYAGITNGMGKLRAIRNVRILDNCKFELCAQVGGGAQYGMVDVGTRTGWVDLEVAHSYFGESLGGGVADHAGRNIQIHHNHFEMRAATDNRQIWPIAYGEDMSIFPDDRRTWGMEVHHNDFVDCDTWDQDGSKDVYIHHNRFYRSRSRALGTFGRQQNTRIEDNEFIEGGQRETSGTWERSAISVHRSIKIKRNTFRDDQTTRATLTTALAGVQNDLKFTAWDGGVAGNSIRVRYVNPGTPNAALSVTVSALDITVNLATDGASAITSTAAQIRTAVNASFAHPLVFADLAPANDGTGVVTALAFTNLASGSAVAAPTQLYGIAEVAAAETDLGPGEYIDNDFGNTPNPFAFVAGIDRVVRSKPDLVALAYSATIATDAAKGDQFTIVATNGTAFTISTPINAGDGMEITYDIKNSSGGAHGVITWGAGFLNGGAGTVGSGAFAGIANGKRRTISFYYDGTNWIERTRSADI